MRIAATLILRMLSGPVMYNHISPHDLEIIIEYYSLSLVQNCVLKMMSYMPVMLLKYTISLSWNVCIDFYIVRKPLVFIDTILIQYIIFTPS